MNAEKFNFVQAKHFYLNAPKQPAGTCFVLHADFERVTERLEDEWKSNNALMRLLTVEKRKAEKFEAMLRKIATLTEGSGMSTGSVLARSILPPWTKNEDIKMTECTTDFELLLQYRDQTVVLAEMLAHEQEARAKSDSRVRELERAQASDAGEHESDSPKRDLP